MLELVAHQCKVADYSNNNAHGKYKSEKGPPTLPC